MKTCGCPSDTLSSLLRLRLARRVSLNLGVGAQGEAGLAEPSRQVNRPAYTLSCLGRGAP
jgi:hypothetical protein